VAEQGLSQTPRWGQAIIDGLGEAVIALDENRTVALFNRQAEELFGYRAEEILGHPLDRLVPLSYRAVHPAQIETFAAGPVRHRQMGSRDILTGVHKSGAEIPIEITISKCETEGRRLLLAVARDATRRKQAEEALCEANAMLERRVEERTAELAAANEELRMFAYVVSHDLRAPLITLKGFAGELRAAVARLEPMVAGAGEISDAQRATGIHAFQNEIPEALEFIDAASRQMDRRISGMLKLSRLGRRALVFESVDLAALAGDIGKTLGHQLRERQASVAFGALPTIIADRDSMEAVLANLLANAVQYLVPDRPGRLEIWAERLAEETVVHVRDNGRGIASEDLDKVFEPFRRVGTPDVPGEGMGLAFAKVLIRRHGGRIWLTSTPGVGTTFHFTVPHHVPDTEGHSHVC
jgi:PAS domain S-box-containing protein